MSYGLTDQGFILKRLEDIIVELRIAYTEAFGAIDVEDASVFGQIIGIQSRFLAEVWEELEKIYLSQYPSSANGVSLHRVIEMNNMTPLAALPTSLKVQLRGTEGTIIPIAPDFTVSDGKNYFNLSQQVTITKNVVQKAVFKIETATVGDTYTVTIDGVDYSYICIPMSTTDSIAQELLDDILAGCTFMRGTRDENTVYIYTNSVNTTFAVSVNAKVSLEEFWTPANFVCSVAGKIPVFANYITSIETPLSGVDEAINMFEGILGRDAETDDELRIRRINSLRSRGSVLEAIVTRILEDVQGVVTCYGYENTADTVDIYGRPPNTIHIVLQGGDEQEIADKLWQLKSGGIGTFGEISKTVVDSQGDTHIINFSRPVSKYAHIKITYYLNSEESFPSNGVVVIKDTVISESSNFTVGKDIILQRFMGPIYKQVTGIQQLVIEGALTAAPGDVPVFSQNNVTVSPVEIALFDISRVTVLEG